MQHKRMSENPPPLPGNGRKQSKLKAIGPVKLAVIAFSSAVIFVCAICLAWLKVQEDSEQHSEELKQLALSHSLTRQDQTKTEGQKVYQNCVACHQLNGEGVAFLFPPLANNYAVLADSPEYLIRVILHGIEGPIEVAGKEYNSPAALSWEMLSDTKIASVASMIRQNTDWHDGRTASRVTTEQVAEIRKDKKDHTYALKLRSRIIASKSK